MATGYVWHERYGWHDTGTAAGFLPAGGYVQPYQHYENPDTKRRLAALVEVSGLLGDLSRVEAVAATEEDLLRVHTRDYVERIKRDSALRGGDCGDGNSPFGPGGYEIACLAAGGTIAAAAAVARGDVQNAYALVRPPGHHAIPQTGMGFCIFSNLGVAIRAVRATHGVGRVAVVDWDVHHGNGTETIFYEDPSTLTLSIHQDQLFPPESGYVEHRGRGAGLGSAVNVPLPAGSGNGAYIETFHRVVIPELRRFRPEMIFVASGFDSGAGDPLGRMMVTSSGYREMTNLLVEAADEICDGRLVVSHEGGYSPIYVPFCGLAVIERLAGIRTEVEDPFEKVWGPMPAQKLQSWQEEVIADVERVLQSAEAHLAETDGPAPS
ncbi:MAG: class II histone deacetylase [Streptosporangiaceae bacterium]